MDSLPKSGFHTHAIQYLGIATVQSGSNKNTAADIFLFYRRMVTDHRRNYFK